MTTTRCVSLPEELCRSAEQKFRHRFGSLEELLTALMTELLSEDAARLDEGEQRIIEQRLKGLGYI
ncbi:MAG TPA: hypothetical protein VF133_05505 [Terriglobales bacterium]|jgi:hypothetical protein